MKEEMKYIFVKKYTALKIVLMYIFVTIPNISLNQMQFPLNSKS